MSSRKLHGPGLALLTLATMLAFAGNSLLCRCALRNGHISPADFTTIRLLSGAGTLGLALALSPGRKPGAGSWGSAAILLVYATCFSFAYGSLSAATGALLLFGAVQATMIGRGLWEGERLRARHLGGLLLALGGLVVLFLPGLAAPPVLGALTMLGSGVFWGIYSLHGRGSGDPIRVTAGNLLRATPFAAALSLGLGHAGWPDVTGTACAIVSGSLSTGLGYVAWYTLVPALRATHAAVVQLSVPVFAALGGVLLLGEPLTPRLALASAAILAGIGLVVLVPFTAP